MNAPQISVVIPTRNRCYYLKYAIKTVLDQWEEDVELVVSDNHSSDDTHKYLMGLNDSRVKVFRPKKPLSMSQHFEFALKKAKGLWITLLGDDDGLMPYFFQLAKKMLEKQKLNYDVIYGPRAYFFWPGVEKVYGKNGFDFTASGNFREISSKESLFSLIYGSDVYIEFPQFYTGTIFARRLVERIRERHPDKKIFHSINPDANSTALILLNTKKALKIGLPFAWVGSSNLSIGIQALMNSRKENKPCLLNDFFSLYEKSKKYPFHTYSCLSKLRNFKAIFLEALYTTSIKNNYASVKLFKDKVTKYALHVSLLKDLKKGGTHPFYSGKILKDNKINIPLFLVFKILSPLLLFAGKCEIKLWQIPKKALFKTQKISIKKFNSSKIKNIIQANQELCSGGNIIPIQKLIERVTA